MPDDPLPGGMRYDELEYRVLREALEWILERCAEDLYGTDEDICQRARAALELADMIRGETSGE